jgi:hypothetical protein
MRNVSRLTLAACMALCSLALAAPSAMATRAIRLDFVGDITKQVDDFTITAFGGEVRIRCRLIMRGRLGPLIEKVRVLPAGRFGQITFAETAECRSNLGGARVIVLIEQERPLNLRYDAFLGFLPQITGILYRKLRFEFKVVEAVVGECLFSGPVGLLIAFPPVEEAGGRRFNQETFNVPNRVPLIAGGLCPEFVEVSGRGRITPPLRAFLVD